MADSAPIVQAAGAPQASAVPLARFALMARAAAITFGIVMLLAFWPLAAIARYREISRSTLEYQLRLEDPVLVMTGIVFVCLLASIVFSFRKLRHYNTIHEIQSGFRDVIANSYFGQGHFAGWTHTNPDAHLGELEYPNPDDVALPANIVAVVEREVAVAEPEPVIAAVETADYVVQRRDSWWKLAEAFFEDPSRWEQIRALNLGREVETGVVIEEETALRSGWIIKVPVA